jgi:hypothetical protein
MVHQQLYSFGSSPYIDVNDIMLVPNPSGVRSSREARSGLLPCSFMVKMPGLVLPRMNAAVEASLRGGSRQGSIAACKHPWKLVI